MSSQPPMEWYEPAKADATHLDWLARTVEDVIEPELPIIDVSVLSPHHLPPLPPPTLKRLDNNSVYMYKIE